MHISRFDSDTFLSLPTVILAGGIGNRMFPLTIGQCKSLLPIANRPLLTYQLHFLENSGFTDIIIITKSEYEKDIRAFLETQTVYDLKSVKVVVSDAAGTADALRSSASEIGTDSDFFVISGDVISTVSLATMAGLHRLRRATVTSMYKRKSATSLVPVVDKKEQEEDMSSQLLGVDEDTGRILYARMRYAVQTVHMNKAIMQQFPKISFKSDLQQAHIYIFAPTVLTLLEQQPHISSIQADLLPYLTTAQFVTDEATNAWARVEDKIPLDADMASFTKTYPTVSTYAYIAPDDCFLERANTLPMYTALNFRVARDEQPMAWPPVADGNCSAQAKEVCRTATLNNCLVGDDFKLEPSTLNNAIVGSHCRVGKGVRLTNSIVMDYAVLEPGAIVTDSIICRNAVISTKATVKKCRVAMGVTVGAESSHEGESIQQDGFGSDEGEAWDEDEDEDAE